MVGIVMDRGMSICRASDGMGAIADGRMAHACARAFTVADIASGFARLPDHSPPA